MSLKLFSNSFGIGLGALGPRDPDTDVLKKTFGWTGVVVNKGVQGSECMTGRRLVSPAFGRQIFFWNPLYFGLKAAQNIDLRTLGYVNNLVLVVASNVIPAN